MTRDELTEAKWFLLNARAMTFGESSNKFLDVALSVVAEAERLTAAIAEAYAQQHTYAAAVADAVELRAEVARLRTALELLTDSNDPNVQRIAEQALKGRD